MRVAIILALYAWASNALPISYSLSGSSTPSVPSADHVPMVAAPHLDGRSHSPFDPYDPSDPRAHKPSDRHAQRPHNKSPEPAWIRRPSTRKSSSSHSWVAGWFSPGKPRQQGPKRKANVAHVHGPDDHSPKPHFHAGLHNVPNDDELCDNCPTREPFAREETTHHQKLFHAEKAEVSRIIADAQTELNKARHDDMLDEARTHARLKAYLAGGPRRL